MPFMKPKGRLCSPAGTKPKTLDIFFVSIASGATSAVTSARAKLRLGFKRERSRRSSTAEPPAQSFLNGAWLQLLLLLYVGGVERFTVLCGAFLATYHSNVHPT